MSSPSLNLLAGDPTTWGVPAIGKTFVGINLSGQLTLVNNDGSGGAVISPLTPAAPAQIDFTNNSGTTTLTPSVGVTTVVGTIGGSARSVPVVLATSGMVDGMTLEAFISFPALDSLVINFYNTVGSGSPITDVASSTAGGITTALLKFVFQSSTGLWACISRQMPAV